MIGRRVRIRFDGESGFASAISQVHINTLHQHPTLPMTASREEEQTLDETPTFLTTPGRLFSVHWLAMYQWTSG